MVKALLVLGGVFVGLFAGARLLFAAKAPAASPSPGSAAPAATPPAKASGESALVWFTPPDDAVLHPSGFVPFRGVMVTALPLIDRRNGQFARLRYKDAKTVADRMGAELMTTALVDAINDEGLLLDAEPCELVKTTYDQTHMATLEYAIKEDNCIRSQLTNWDGKTPVGNGWKDWIRGAAKGMALNYGWRKKDSKQYVQTLGTKHNEDHTDYSQLTRLVKGA